MRDPAFTEQACKSYQPVSTGCGENSGRCDQAASRIRRSLLLALACRGSFLAAHRARSADTSRQDSLRR